MGAYMIYICRLHPGGPKELSRIYNQNINQDTPIGMICSECRERLRQEYEQHKEKRHGPGQEAGLLAAAPGE